MNIFKIFFAFSLTFLIFSKEINGQTLSDKINVNIRTKSIGLVSGKLISEKNNNVKINTEEFGEFSIYKSDIIVNELFTNNTDKLVTINTRDGNEYVGMISSQDDDKVVLQTEYYGSVVFPKKDIISIEKKLFGYDGIKKNVVSINLIGNTPIAGITYERLFSKYLSMELGVGFVSFAAGLKVYPFQLKNGDFTFYTGLSFFYFTAMFADGSNIYLPIGFSSFGKNGINFAFDIGPRYTNEKNVNSNLTFYGGVKIGFRF